MPPHRRVVAISLAALSALAWPALPDPVLAGPSRPEAVDAPATPVSPAGRIPHTSDSVSIGQSGPMTAALMSAAEEVALSLGIPSVRGRAFNVGLHAVRRGAATVQQASGTSGLWQYPMSATVLPVDAIGRVMSLTVSSVVAQGTIVMSATSAALRGALAGDVVELVAADGGIRTFVIGYVAPDAEIGGAELVMSPEQADLLGATIVTRVLIFGQFDRAQLDAALDARGLYDGFGVRISRSWNPPNPDSLLGSARMKTLLGEFDYRVNGDGSLTLDPDWVGANIVRINYQSIAVRASCHRTVATDLQAALTEVAAAGLAWAIDLANTNTYGGCWNPRYSRVSGSIGSVSRHAWGMAFDTNTVANAQGRTPQMDCRVVRIFRKHNFAWGGNFLVPDGMHFEWVGEPRHTLQYPSKYCPNLPGGATESTGAPVATQADTMFADDAWVLAGDDHSG